MDWKKITEKINPYIKKMDPYIDKAKEYWQKAVKFTEDQIQTTPLFIHTHAEYDALVWEKRVVLIAYDDNHSVAQDIRLLSPIWVTRAFMDTAKLRFISMSESQELIHALGLSSPLDMRVRYQWEETLHLTDLQDIKKWWQDPTYKNMNTPNNVVSTDPLAGK